MLSLVSSDNYTFIIPEVNILANDKSPMLSKTLSNMIDTYQIKLTESINTPIDRETLQIIVEYCNLQYINPPIFLDYIGDKYIYDDIEKHCQYHLENNDNFLNHRCEYQDRTICRTWGETVKKYEAKCKQYMNKIDENTRNMLWKHLLQCHSVQYCCPDDIELYKKESSNLNNIYRLWAYSFLEKYMFDIKCGKNLNDSQLMKIYLASEFLDMRGLREDIAYILSNYLLDIHNKSNNDYSKLRDFLNQEDDICNEDKNDFNLLSHIIFD